jgi:hypothetical protein
MDAAGSFDMSPKLARMPALTRCVQNRVGVRDAGMSSLIALEENSTGRFV